MTNNPTTHCMDPVRWNHSYLIFLHFLVKLSEIFFLGYIHRTLTWTLKAMPHCAYMVCTIPIFFLIFLKFFYLIHLNFLFWTSTLDPANTSQQYWPPFLFFSWFYYYYFSYFHPKLQMFPYLDMHTGPWKQHPFPQHHHQPSPIFFLIFRLFYCYFSFSIAKLSIFGNMQ